MKLVVAALLLLGLVARAQSPGDEWLTWSAARAEAVGKAAYVRIRVGGLFDTRVLKTERAYNYKLAATWFHADAIRATARVRQLSERLSEGEARALAGVLRRNYDYDRFWVVFPHAHADGAPVVPRQATHAELVVRISGREGRVRWPVPASGLF